MSKLFNFVFLLMANNTLGFQLPNLEDFMELNPLTISPETSVIDAVTKMNRPRIVSLTENTTVGQNISHSSYILVLERSRLVGVLTERDVVKLSAKATNLKTVTVGEVMTKNVITLKKSDFQDIYQIMSIIRGHKIRHLPVVDDFGQLEGIISSEGIGRTLNPTNLLKLRSVADVIKTNVLRASPNSSVLSISQLMAKQGQSCVVIVETKSDSLLEPDPDVVVPVGIITERDLVQFQILGLDLANTPASTVMSSPLACMKSSDSLLRVQQEMKKLKVRRMVVTQESGKLEGTIGLQDMLGVFNPTELYGVINTLKQELKQQTQHLQEEIQQRQTSEKLLQENQHLLELFIRHTPAAIAMLDLEMRYIAVSDRWIEDYQLRDKDIIGQTHYEVFPEIPERWKQDHQDCLGGKVKFLKSEEDSFIGLDGRVDWLRWELRPWHDREGQIGGLMMFSEVITEKKLLEQKLQSSEAQMRAIFEAMTDLVFTIDISNDSIQILPTQFITLNNDIDPSYIIEKLQNKLFDNAEGKNYRSLNQQILETRQTFEFEFNFKLDNLLIWFSANVSAVSETTVIWVARNITKRKEMDQNLFAEKELADVTLKSIGDAVITTDALGKVRYLNPIAEKLTGWKTTQVKGQLLTEFFQIVHQFSRKPIANPIDSVLQENRIYKLAADSLLISRDGSEYAIEDSAAPIQDR